jgi:hypothetical protein
MLNLTVLRRSWQTWMSADFRRDGPYWLQLVWTGVFGLGLALLFTFIGFVLHASAEGWRDPALWWHWLKPNLAMCLLISYFIHGLLELGVRLLGRQRLRALNSWQRTLFFAGIPMLGVALGWPLAIQLVGPKLSAGNAATSWTFSILFSVLLSLALHFYFDGKAREQQAARRHAEAQLRLLQAQIEPHFLFNTLANVASLIDPDPAKARQMLENFIAYLRASLQKLRLEHSTVGAELDMAESYLRLLQVRMADRLRFVIDADVAARSARVPPLLLQPLVENAIHHGLEPKLDGGEVRIRAHVDGATLQITVDDDGLGLGGPPRVGRQAGTGMALENVRARLASLYGDEAALTMSPREPGTRAHITLPYTAA